MEYLLKVSAIVVIFYLCYKLFLQRTTFFNQNRWFLFLGLITAFVIPLIVIPVYVESSPIVFSKFLTETNFEPIISATPIVVEETEKPFNILDYLPIMYGFGLLLFGVKFCIQMVSLSILILKNKRRKENGVTFIETSTNQSPFSFFNWIIYNPNNFSKTELKQILTHEKIHTKQKHSLDVLLGQISCIVLWFNPFIWLYSKVIKQNLEFIADHKTQEKLACKTSYQKTLLKASISVNQLSIGNNFYTSLIKKRIVMLNKSKSKKIHLLKFAIVLPLLAIFLMNFNTKEVYVENETNSETINRVVKNKPEEFVIYNHFSDEKMQVFKTELKAKGFDFKLKELERNSENQITSIDFMINKNGIDGAYRMSSVKPLSTIVIEYLKDKNKFTINTLDFINQNKAISSKENTVEIRIDKNATATSLNNQKKNLKENYNLNFSYKIIERNANNEITKFNYNLDNGTNSIEKTIGPFGTISPIIIKYNPETKLMIDYTLNKNGDPEYGSSQSLSIMKSYIISNNYTDKSLKSTKDKLKENGVLVKFTNIKRNDKGEILAIDITATSKKGSVANFNVNDTSKPIKPISISSYDNGNGIKIGPSNFSLDDIDLSAKNKSEKFLIHNHFSEEKMQTFKEELKNNGYDFNLKELKRNKRNQIISIVFEIEKNGAKGEYGMGSGQPLETIVIEYSEVNKKISIKTLEFINSEKLINKSKNVVEIVIEGNKNVAVLEKQKIELKEKYNIDFTYEIREKTPENEYGSLGFAFNNGIRGIGPISGVGLKDKVVVKYDTKTKLFTSHIVKENGDFGAGISLLLDIPKGYGILKDYKDETFKKIVKELKKDGVFVKFTNIKRNDKDEIIAISISAKYKKGKVTNFNVDTNEPIGDISIQYFENSKIINFENSKIKKYGEIGKNNDIEIKINNKN